MDTFFSRINCFLTLFLCLTATVNAAPERRFACWGSFGPPVVSAQCPRDTVIQVVRAGLKVQGRGSGCAYHSADCGCEYGEPGCNMPNVRDKCMGRPACRLDVTQQYINTQGCRGFSDYMFIDFNCVKINLESMHDICTSSVSTHPDGYILSPHYPRPYPADRHCQCTLTAPDQASIELSVLDFEMDDITCKKDTLLIEYDDQQTTLCGHKAGDTHSFISTHSKMYLTFHTNSHKGNGGFWLKYAGSSTVEVQCTSYYKEPDYEDVQSVTAEMVDETVGTTTPMVKAIPNDATTKSTLSTPSSTSNLDRTTSNVPQTDSEDLDSDATEANELILENNETIKEKQSISTSDEDDKLSSESEQIRIPLRRRRPGVSSERYENVISNNNNSSDPDTPLTEIKYNRNDIDARLVPRIKDGQRRPGRRRQRKRPMGQLKRPILDNRHQTGEDDKNQKDKEVDTENDKFEDNARMDNEISPHVKEAVPVDKDLVPLTLIHDEEQAVYDEVLQGNPSFGLMDLAKVLNLNPDDLDVSNYLQGQGDVPHTATPWWWKFTVPTEKPFNYYAEDEYMEDILLPNEKKEFGQMQPKSMGTTEPQNVVEVKSIESPPLVPNEVEVRDLPPSKPSLTDPHGTRYNPNKSLLDTDEMKTYTKPSLGDDHHKMTSLGHGGRPSSQSKGKSSYYFSPTYKGYVTSTIASSDRISTDLSKHNSRDYVTDQPTYDTLPWYNKENNTSSLPEQTETSKESRKSYSSGRYGEGAVHSREYFDKMSKGSMSGRLKPNRNGKLVKGLYPGGMHSADRPRTIPKRTRANGKFDHENDVLFSRGSRIQKTRNKKKYRGQRKWPNTKRGLGQDDFDRKNPYTSRDISGKSKSGSNSFDIAVGDGKGNGHDSYEIKKIGGTTLYLKKTDKGLVFDPFEQSVHDQDENKRVLLRLPNALKNRIEMWKSAIRKMAKSKMESQSGKLNGTKYRNGAELAEYFNLFKQEDSENEDNEFDKLNSGLLDMWMNEKQSTRGSRKYNGNHSDYEEIEQDRNYELVSASKNSRGPGRPTDSNAEYLQTLNPLKHNITTENSHRSQGVMSTINEVTKPVNLNGEVLNNMESTSHKTSDQHNDVEKPPGQKGPSGGFPRSAYSIIPGGESITVTIIAAGVIGSILLIIIIGIVVRFVINRSDPRHLLRQRHKKECAMRRGAHRGGANCAIGVARTKSGRGSFA